MTNSFYMKTINVRQVFTGVWSKELRKYKDRVTDQKDQGSSFMCDRKTGMGKTLNQEKHKYHCVILCVWKRKKNRNCFIWNNVCLVPRVLWFPSGYQHYIIGICYYKEEQAELDPWFSNIRIKHYFKCYNWTRLGLLFLKNWFFTQNCVF